MQLHYSTAGGLSDVECHLLITDLITQTLITCKLSTTAAGVHVTCMPQAPYLKGLLHAALLHRRRDAVNLDAVRDALAACLNTRATYQVSSSEACRNVTM